MKKIYLFRHGETQANVDELIYGITNVPLNETGKKQAEKTGKMLLNKGINRIYSSYLDRALDTAKIIAEEIGVKDVIVVNDLRETDFGDLEGTVAPLKDRDKKGYIDDVEYPNGETRYEARKRFSDAVLDICKNDKNDVIAIAAHGNVLRQFLVNFGFEDTSRVNNCEVIEAECDGKNIKILKRICVR